MTNYILSQNIDLSYTGWVSRKEDDGSGGAFNESHTAEWQRYQDWIAEGNTPEDQYSLDDIKQVCFQYADQQYEQAVKEPINDGTDNIDVSIESKSKIHNAKATGRTSVKVKVKNGKAKTYTDVELDALLDAIEDRDDAALDELDLKYDAIEAATDISELEPYLPPQV